MAIERTTKYPPVRPIQVLATCPQCQGINKLVLNYNNIRRYSRCQACGELILTVTFWPIVITNDLEHPIF